MLLLIHFAPFLSSRGCTHLFLFLPSRLSRGCCHSFFHFFLTLRLRGCVELFELQARVSRYLGLFGFSYIVDVGSFGRFLARLSPYVHSQRCPLPSSVFICPLGFSMRMSFAISSTLPKMGVKHFKDIDEFKQVIGSGTPILIDFTAAWCGPCKVISPIFEKLSDEASSATVEFYKVDVDEQADIAQELGIRAMPTFKLFKDGQEVETLVGAAPQKLQELITQAAAL